MRYLFAVLVLLACSSTPTPGPPQCTPGAQVACACVGGGQGAQVCTSGATLGPCTCPDGGASDVAAVDVLAADVGIDAASADAGGDVAAVDAAPVDVGADALTDRAVAADVNCRNPREADRDGDGQESIACGGMDCNDDDPLVGPNAAEFCDGIDQNCDGNADGPLPDGGIDTASARWCESRIGSGSPGPNTRCVLPGATPATCALTDGGACVLCSAGHCMCPAVSVPTCFVCSRDLGAPRDCAIFTVINGNPDRRSSCR